MMYAPYHSKIVERLSQEFEISVIADPFVGAGSSMNEALARGVDFVGQDINPLAILLCRVQYGPFYLDALATSLNRIMQRVPDINGVKLPEFLGDDKWFTNPVLDALATLRDSILEEESPWARRFWWVCLAETVRYVSRDRLSTHKLHIHPEKGTELSKSQVYDTFREISERNVRKYRKKKEALDELNVLGRASPDSEISLSLGDTASHLDWDSSTDIDLVFTSPPYGDNRTTIPYGQASFLPLSLIPEGDLPLPPISDSTKNTNRLDGLSLGGNRRRGVDHLTEHPEVVSMLEHRVGDLEGFSESAQRRLGLFAVDLSESLSNLQDYLSPGAHCVFTVGRRNVDGKEIPVDKILEDFLSQSDYRVIDRYSREIRNKRGAQRNEHGPTISREFTSVLEVQG